MQTFLPYPSFERSALVLDRQRLGKQRVEAKQVLQSLLNVDKLGNDGNTGQHFINHPIYAQWSPYPEALLTYTWYMCREWRRRGYQDNIMPWLFQVAGLRELRIRRWVFVSKDPESCPWWLGAPRLHIYHRANLMVKLPSHYAQFRWPIPPKLMTGFGYNWPGVEPNTWRRIRRLER